MQNKTRGFAGSITTLCQEVIPALGPSINDLSMRLSPDSNSQMMRAAVRKCTGLKAIDVEGDCNLLAIAIKELQCVPLKEIFLSCIDGGDPTAPIHALSKNAKHLRFFACLGRLPKIDVIELLVRTAREMEMVCILLTHGVQGDPEFAAQIGNVSHALSMLPKLKELEIVVVQETRGISVIIDAVADICYCTRLLKGMPVKVHAVPQHYMVNYACRDTSFRT